MKTVLKEAKRLHDLGFAILWIKPKSKMPVENGWTKGPRKTWRELESTYHDGMNLGVRLGSPSVIDKKNLAVIDCDVKSTDEKHLKEMEEKLKELIGDKKTPTVMSGRGNGSRHIYFRTGRPIKPKKWAQSQEKVKVKMPSASPSKSELNNLTESDLRAGMRIRPAWEISIMGEGQQTILPPSIHPDSNKAYLWGVWGSLPELEIGQNASDQNDARVKDDLKLAEIDFMDPRFTKKSAEMILTGEGCEDRSAGLFIVAMDMLKSGFNDAEILTALTEPETFLGQCGYDHTKSESRKRAAEWVNNYTLQKARREVLAVEQFKGEVVEEKLSPEDTKKQVESLVPKVEKHWTEKLERSHDGKGPAKSTFLNMINILIHAVGPEVFRFNEFSIQDIYGMDTPWGGKKGAALKDIDALQIKQWFAERYKFEAPTVKVHEVINTIANQNKFHPVREFIETLEWDGTPRMDSWIKDYCGGRAPEPYLSAISRKFLVAMIARVYQPGVKFDHMLIFEGKQGSGKSTAFKILSAPWFSDTPLDPNDKDSVVNLANVWVNEQGELSVLSKASIEALKRFITCTEDKIRLPYGKRSEHFPRQVVFAGSTNKDAYLRDTTGNRRFWPVNVGQTKFAELARVRNQLLAEAKFAFDLGEPLYLEEKLMEEQATDVQNSKMVEDIFVEKIQTFLNSERDNFNKHKFTLSDLFGEFGAFYDIRNPTVGDQLRATEALKVLGYEKQRQRSLEEKGKDGKRKRQVFWVKEGATGGQGRATQ